MHKLTCSCGCHAPGATCADCVADFLDRPDVREFIAELVGGVPATHNSRINADSVLAALRVLAKGGET